MNERRPKIRFPWFALAAFAVAACAPAVVVDAPASTSGATTTGGGGAGGAGGGGACPAERPVDATPCEGALSCEYGTADCKNIFQCSSGIWLTDHHVCPPVCPAQPPSGGSACQSEGQSCEYYDPYAVCSETTLAACGGGAWAVTSPSPTCPACPAAPPEPGSDCTPCCPSCTYPSAGGCGEVTASCLTGGGPPSWAVDGGCEPVCEAYADAQGCEADPACRWLVPGCGDPALPADATGCHPKADCVDGAPCTTAGQTCQKAVINPCWDSACQACGQDALVCL